MERRLEKHQEHELGNHATDKFDQKHRKQTEHTLETFTEHKLEKHTEHKREEHTENFWRTGK